MHSALEKMDVKHAAGMKCPGPLSAARALGRAIFVAAAFVAACTGEVQARPRLENICSISGQQEQRLIGLGLVTGLKGTGDGGKYLPMIRSLGMALQQLNNHVEGP